jgi:phosphoglycerate-specific signal transduction histidine kinase
VPHPEIQARSQQIDLDFIRQDLFKLLDSMKTGAERINKIVSSLRNFSRLQETGTKTVDLHEGLESTLALLETRLP